MSSIQLPSPRFKNTKWTDIRPEDVKLKDLPATKFRVACNKKLILPNGQEFSYNDTVMYKIVEKYGSRKCYDAEANEQMLDLVVSADSCLVQLFLMDGDELKDCLKSVKFSSEKDHGIELWNALNVSRVFSKLKAFFKSYRKKKIYIRKFSPHGSEEWVFAEEVIFWIPIALKSQGDKVDKKKHNKLISEWNTKRKCMPKKMTIAQLYGVLEDFDIDKSKITLVPDIHYTDTIRKAFWSPGNCKITVLGTYRVELMEKEETVFWLFQTVICDVDMKKEVCSRKGETKEDFRDAVLEVMNNWMKSSEQFVSFTTRMEGTERLKAHRNYTERKKRMMLNPLIKLFDAEFGDTITCAFFVEEFTKHGLKIRNARFFDYDEVFPAWKMRLAFYEIWANTFFKTKKDTLNLKDIVMNGVFRRTPILKWSSDCDMDFMNLLGQMDPSFEAYVQELEAQSAMVYDKAVVHPWLEKTSWRDRKYIIRCEKWEIREKMEKEKKRKEALEAAEAAKAAKAAKKKKNTKKAASNPPSSPDHCQRTLPFKAKDSAIKGLKIAKTEQKIADPKKQTNETPSIPKESSACRKCLNASEICQEAKKERDKIAKELKTMREDQGKKSNKDLKNELKGSKGENQKLVDEKAKLLSEIEEMKVEMAGIEESKKALQDQLEASMETIQQKDQKITALQGELAKGSSVPLAQKELALEMKKLLIDLQDQRDTLKCDDVVRKAQERANSLIALTSREPVKQFARHELLVFGQKAIAYEKDLEANIVMIQQHLPKVQFQLAPVSPCPTFSEAFEMEYRKAEEENNRLGNECVICKGQKLPHHLLSTCSHCPLSLHWECAMKWKKVNPRCPICKKEF